jgi:hypothetical protein
MAELRVSHATIMQLNLLGFVRNPMEGRILERTVKFRYIGARYRAKIKMGFFLVAPVAPVVLVLA